MWQELFGLKGRRGRLGLLGYNILFGVIFGLITVVEQKTNSNSNLNEFSLTGLILAILLVVVFWGHICQVVKRLHDIGWSGWFVLATIIIPVVIDLILLFIPGQRDDNRYGPPPRALALSKSELELPRY